MPKSEDKKPGVKITWLGAKGEPDSNIWNGIVFEKGKAVEVTDEHMINKARTNQFYKVEG